MSPSVSDTFPFAAITTLKATESFQRVEIDDSLTDQLGYSMGRGRTSGLILPSLSGIQHGTFGYETTHRSPLMTWEF